MVLSKDSILQVTNRGLDVFKHYLGSRFSKVGKSFKSPFYQDSKASCYIYLDKKADVFKFKDFGDAEFSGDCFFLAGKMLGLDCEDSGDFIKVLETIDSDLCLMLGERHNGQFKISGDNPVRTKPATVKPITNEGFETAKLKLPIQTKPYSKDEISYWGQYGIDLDTLNKYNVISIETFIGIGKEGKEYTLKASIEKPIFGYQGKRHTKLYMPFSTLRFLYAGELTENYVFGFDQLPVRGDVLFFTGGEKDVLSLVSHGFNAICFNSETANIPKNLLRGLSYRFKHITLVYDVDETGLKSMERICKELKAYQIRSLRLPLAGTKTQKDVSDFFKLGHGPEDLMMLFVEMLDHIYEESLSVMKSCEIDFEKPPAAPEPIISINEVTVGSPGNLMCVAGSEGSGKTNFLGGILSGTIKPTGVTVDTLGTSVRENLKRQAVLLYDTEQSEFQLYKNLTYILKRSEIERPPPWFKAFCLVGIARSERMNLILESMDKFYYEHDGIHLMVIDGIADLLGGVNDEESSVKLIEELFRLAAIYNTCIICVVHMAPSGMKLRGHLGSEVQRKAAGILLVEKDENNPGTSVVKALKVRDGSPHDVPLVQFGWDKTQGRHVYLGEKSKEESQTRKINDLFGVAQEIFAEKATLTAPELALAIMEAMDIKDRQARTYIKFMKENNIIEKNPLNSAEFRKVYLPF